MPNLRDETWDRLGYLARSSSVVKLPTLNGTRFNELLLSRS